MLTNEKSSDMSVSAFAHDKYPPARIRLPKISARSCRSSDCNVQTPHSAMSAHRIRLLPTPLQGFNDPLSRCVTQEGAHRTGTSFSQLQTRPKGLARVRDSHPIPLSSNEQECVSGPPPNRVAHLPQKPTCYSLV